MLPAALAQKAILTKRVAPRSFLKSSSETLDITVRILCLVFTVGLLIVVLYYENTILDTPFEAFMDSQSFGVRFTFTAFGVLINLFWEHYFSVTSMYYTFWRLSQRACPASESILLTQPTTVYSCIVKAARKLDFFLAAVASAGILSKFTPLLLSTVPFRDTITWKIHEAGTWASVAILSYMTVVIIGSFTVKKPFMPVEPSTVAGYMYYVCDSHMLRDFEGFHTLSITDKNRLLHAWGRSYKLGSTLGISGRWRIGVDYVKPTWPGAVACGEVGK
ncbi:hypothetical protein GQ53DRAFT_857968 [Thozetella sp. PMI_491]|nr:hypothetical protein GQ53DRAFT_857968 [Thozetella sp. PMI_491]